MAVTPYEQRSYPGAAADTTLAAGITSAALSFTVATGDGIHYPDGSGGPFWVVIDYDVSTTEKLHCTSRSGDLFTVDVRGADGTTAQAHSLGAKVRACWTATDAQEANRAASNTVGKVTSKGDLLVGTGANVVARLGVGANNSVHVADSTQTTGTKWATSVSGLTLPSAVLDAASTVNGVTGTQIAADHTSVATVLSAWTTWSPVITAPTNPTYTDNGSAYKVNGKTLSVRMSVSFNTVGSGAYTLAMPGGLSAQATCYGAAFQFAVGSSLPLRYAASGTSITFARTDNNSAFNAASNAAFAVFAFSGVIEVT